MSERPAETRPASLGAILLAVLMTAFIVYGSLYPFRFHPLPERETLGQAVLAALRHRPGGRGDLVANTLLYMPLGFALAAAVARWRALAAMAFSMVLCAGLSALLEVLQLHVRGRTASGWDLLLNTVGGLAGAAVALAVAPRNANVRIRLGDPAAALLLTCWLGYRLYPYVPALDLSEWRASLKPLLLPDGLDPWRALRLMVLWLVAGRLLEATRARAAGFLLFAVMALGTTLAAVPIVERRLSQPELLAAVLAVPVWMVLRGRPWSDRLLLGAMLAVVLVEGTAPYRLAEHARDFGWIPFRSVLRGQWGTGLQAIMLKVFLYGALIWLTVRTGLRLGAAAAGVVSLALAISWLQTWLPGRSAEITDAVLVGLVALTCRLLLPGGRSDGPLPLVAQAAPHLPAAR